MESGTRTFYLGRYNCIEQLGTGPLGETFRAKIYGVAGFEKQFAVKRLHPHLGADEAFVGRFVQAASAFAALDHPRIVRVHEVNAQGASYYIVVDLVRGLDLRRLLDLLQQRGEALPADAAMTIACDVADALEHAHGRTNALPSGVLHLGLTPSSVMLTYEGEAKLIDVGLMAALVRPGWGDDDALAPTLAYLSPEELRGEPVDARADVFSLGVVLHELLGGARVFFSDRAAELRKAIEGGPPAPPPADPRLQQVVTRALRPDREQRFASMAELRAAVQAILGGRADRARSDLSALVRRLALPRERRTGAFAAVSLPTGGTTPLAAGTTPAAATATASASASAASVKPPPVPTPRPWAPPTPRPPIGPQLSPVPQANTLAGIGPDDQALVPIELIELPGSPTEKAMPTVAEDAETNRVARAEASEVAERQASTPPPLPADAVAVTEANGATAEAKGTNGKHAAAPEATWTPPAVVPPPPSPAPAFAKPAVDRPAPVEPARQAVPGARLPPRAGANRAVLGTVVLLAGAGVLAVYFGLSDYFNAESTLATKPAATEKAAPEKAPAEKPIARNPTASGATAAPTSGPALAPTSGAVVASASGTVVAPASGAAVARASGAPVAPVSGATVAAASRAAATPTTVPPSTAQTAAGTFAVVTTPPGAAVFVDGAPSGTTPAQLDVAPGRHHLVVAGEHSRLVKRDVDVQPGGNLQLTLEPAKLPAEVAGPAGLKVRCRTKGELRIFVDGADAGLSCPNDERIDVTAGTHKIGLFSPRTGEMHEVEHEVTEADHSTRVYVKY